MSLELSEITAALVDQAAGGQGDPIVFLHGNPTSSYLWRNVIPHVADRGRCIAPDLIGMGRSDKPAIAYRFADHAAYLDGLLDQLDLTRVTLVVHDWGSALGFDWAMRHPERVRAIAFMEAMLLPVASWDDFNERGRPMFQAMRTPGVGEEMIFDRNFFVEQILPANVVRGLTPAEHAAYRAPFLERDARKPTLAWVRELPIAGSPPELVATLDRYRAWLAASPIPKLMLTVEPGVLIPPPVAAWCRAHLPALEAIALGAGRHFVQEDHPHALGRALASWIARLA